MTFDEEAAKAWLAAERAKLKWPADGLLPGNTEETLLWFADEVVRKAFQLPGLREDGSSSMYRPERAESRPYKHMPSGRWIEISVTLLPTDDDEPTSDK
jgi:hypothetical protein